MMKANLQHDKATDVAYVDVHPAPPTQGSIDVQDVTDDLGLRTQVLARIDEDGQFLGLIIQNYSAFTREIRLRYYAFAVEKILDLLVSSVHAFTDTAVNSRSRRFTAPA